MKTSSIVATGTVGVWAVPLESWELDQHPEGTRFKYRLEVGHCYARGAVLVKEQEVSINVEPGIDLVDRAVVTLTKELNDLKESYLANVERINQQISSLLMLSAPSDTIEGALADEE